MTSDKPKIRGLLNQEQSLEKFQLQLIDPPPELSDFFSHFWHVSWGLPKGEIYHQANLPFPHQHLVIDPQRGSGLFGCSTGAFNYEIAGNGSVLGARFWPGCARVLHDASMSELTDNMRPWSDIFETGPKLFEELLKTDLDKLIHKMADLILDKATSKTNIMQDVGNMIAFIEANDEITHVNILADEFNLSSRQLQRLFKDYVGVTPKWVIERYRIFNALDALNKGERLDLADLAYQLGYTDQAHFSKTFKTLTGQSPKRYLKQQL